jgi:predicted peptidase
MTTRRDAIRLIGSASAAAFFGVARDGVFAGARARAEAAAPSLAPGDPKSAERLALIDAFRRRSLGLERAYEARVHKSDFDMPYRLFRPQGGRQVPLVVYLHGSGGLGNDNVKQLGLGNTFGTRVWLLPENQRRFPCFVVAPQTDRGWIRYDFTTEGEQGRAKEVPGLGDGARLAFEVIDALSSEFPIDPRRIYLTRQSMGGAGTWHMIAQRKGFFAAAVPCCGSPSPDDAAESAATPVWSFHGIADDTVPVEVSRDRVAALRKAGAHPLATEYPGVGHEVWEWAYTEPELLPWVFAQRRAG